MLNPFEAPQESSQEAKPRPGFWRALGRGALWGAVWGVAVEFALTVLFLAVAIYRGIEFNEEMGAEFALDMLQALPGFALIGATVGSSARAIVTWFQR